MTLALTEWSLPGSRVTPTSCKPKNLKSTGRSDRVTLLERALQAVPSADEHFLPVLEELMSATDALVPPSERQPLRAKQAKARLAVAWWTRLWADTPPFTIAAAPGSEHFPGAVPAEAPRLKRTVELDPSRRGWISTGLYVPAGELVHARSAGTLYHLAKFARRNRALVIGSATTLVTLLVGLIGTGWGWVKLR